MFVLCAVSACEMIMRSMSVPNAALPSTLLKRLVYVIMMLVMFVLEALWFSIGIVVVVLMAYFDLFGYFQTPIIWPSLFAATLTSIEEEEYDDGDDDGNDDGGD